MKYLQLILLGLGSLFLAAEAGGVADEKLLYADNYFTKCRWGFGTFPHPFDCSKYFKCVMYVPYMRTCPEKQLFDTEKSKCRPEKEVDCGNRQRPGFTTTLIPTDPIVTEVPETSTTEEEIFVSTTEATISTEEVTDETTTEVSSTDEVTAETTTEVSSTTRLRPTGPPDHTCDEDDVNCIITETGDVQDWFICPRDIGSFAHPSSDRLFIFCFNWIPSVKKCGQNLVYSTEHRTCIEKKYFAKLLL